MTEEGRVFRVGQEVRVVHFARVAEIGLDYNPRGQGVIRLETNTAPTGWVDPAQDGLTIDIISEPLPIEPGLYWQADASGRQGTMGDHHTDGKEFHYLNGQGVWVDLGFGAPPSADEPIYRVEGAPF